MNLLIEITVSDSCNKNCSYCFEHGTQCNNDIFDLWKPYILNACEDIVSGKLSEYDSIELTFWGGEPFIRYDRILDLIQLTSKYAFVSYHVYTNGTLRDEILKFVSSPIFKNVSNRFFVQISYDGSPYNELKRGYSFDEIHDQVILFINAGSHVSFKATVCYDSIALFPQVWDSYANLNNVFPNIKYSPTLDSMNSITSTVDNWQEIVKDLCIREYNFHKKYNRFLMTWFDDTQPRLCLLDNRIFLHTDGILYVCHGCPYVKDNRYKLGSLSDNSLKFITESHICKNDACHLCEATYCVYCNMAGMPNGNLCDVWNTGCSKNKYICQMYQVFGYYRRALIYAIIKGK